jgi:hypothetical protein
MNTKKCKDCQEVLPLSDFSEYTKDNRRWYASYCKSCVRVRSRSSDLKKRYGLTVDEFEEMLKQQDYKCGICSDDLTSGRFTHVDHCHSSGKVRKLLCPRCNTGIGKFKDDVELLRKAIDYLNEH